MTTAVTITVKYSCPQCGLFRAECVVPARVDEGVLDWSRRMIVWLMKDHAARSSQCHPASLHDVMIPMTGADRIGGPSLQ